MAEKELNYLTDFFTYPYALLEFMFPKDRFFIRLALPGKPQSSLKILKVSGCG